jgi:glycosyltransferase involved in cell wall biosynthesis
MEKQINKKPVKRIFIVSCIEEDWGGSETLWFTTIPYLLEQGVKVMVLKERINRFHPKFIHLSSLGVLLVDLINASPEKKREELDYANNTFENKIANYCIQMEVFKPDLILINQGVNFDGLYYGMYARKQNVSYCILSHKAVEFFWPAIQDRESQKEIFNFSKRNFFVSNHNITLTQLQFGMTIPNATKIFNPIKTFAHPIPYPSVNDGFHLACIGRIYILDKGQDILIRILSKPIWQERNITIDFIGSGVDEFGLKEMAAFLQVKNIQFKGYVQQDHIWEHYHALILPSRSEGLPLVVQEAMAAGRMVIGTDAGGTAELLQDGVNGFIGDPTLKSFEETMERAWLARNDWSNIGIKAFETFQAFYPTDPVKNFSQQLIDLANG